MNGAAREIEAEILVPGTGGEGAALVLTAPISFWGGVDPNSGRVADVRHPQCGSDIAGTVLFVPGTIGSSSAAAVLLELVHGGRAPAALVLHEPDAILLLGLIVAREMGWQTPVAVKLDRALHAGFEGRGVAVSADGRLTAIAG
jgi:predicted aconitase with swiveling domain